MPQKPPVPVRLNDVLLAKVDFIAKRRRRKRGEFIRMLCEDEVAAYEAENGPISLPPT